MEKIVKIVIKGCSGFCQISEAYEDKVTLTENSFSYEHKPAEESEINPSVNWKYKTSSIDFKVQFEKISKLAIKTLKKIFEYECTDVGEITIDVTFADKTKLRESYLLPSEEFKELFHEIKVICPSKKIPEVLKTSEDYERLRVI